MKEENHLKMIIENWSYGLESKSVSSICQRIKYFSDLSI
jgi:hypothetical protein